MVFPELVRRSDRSVSFVDTELTQAFGGAQVFLGRVLPGLLANGWGVRLITHGKQLPPLVSDLRGSGVEVLDAVWRSPSTVAKAGRRLGAFLNQEPDSAYVVSVSSGIGWAALPHLDASVATVSIAHS